MTKGELDRAKRRALNILDEWIEVTGVVIEHSGYHSELEGIVEDAVEIGAQQALKDYKKDQRGHLCKKLRSEHIKSGVIEDKSHDNLFAIVTSTWNR